ncbi:MAG: hypothetical protein HYR96_11965 [Deltaproteobacteria bacterium]|nr:hypothetical protein [Deltaproteobacteria bacterium]MBI3295093.1 hypothetical protein [Deltaproteobacteria bacterium]
MSKWIWLALFFLTVGAVAWFGTRKPEAPRTELKTEVAREQPTELEAPVVSQIPMTPQLVRPPEPSPYNDTPPNVAVPDHPDYVPPPIYGGAPDQNPYVPPPPAQAYPGDEELTYGDTGEAMPQYLKPQPGSSLEEQEALEAQPPQPPMETYEE